MNHRLTRNYWKHKKVQTDEQKLEKLLRAIDFRFSFTNKSSIDSVIVATLTACTTIGAYSTFTPFIAWTYRVRYSWITITRTSFICFVYSLFCLSFTNECSVSTIIVATFSAWATICASNFELFDVCLISRKYFLEFFLVDLWMKIFF